MVNEWVQEEWKSYAEELGFALQRARERSGYSQKYVADKACISVFTYRKLEHGESNPGTPANPRLKTLVAISRVLEVPIQELLPHR